MKLKKLNSNKEVNISVNRYKVDWERKRGSQFQLDVKIWLKKYWFNHVCLEEFRIPGCLFRFDFINLTKQLIIEMNGAQHEEYNKHFHRGNKINWLRQLQRDEQKRIWAEQNGFSIIEIAPEDLPLSVEFFKKKYDINIL